MAEPPTHDAVGYFLAVYKYYRISKHGNENHRALTRELLVQAGPAAPLHIYQVNMYSDCRR